jgi:hypothetical protein
MSDWTSSDLISLRAAVASGVLSVRYDGPPGRTVTYQSLAEMRSLLAEMNASVNNTAGVRSNYRLVSTKKGF